MSAYFAARRGLRSPDGLLLAGREGASDLSGPGRPVALPPTRHYAVDRESNESRWQQPPPSQRLVPFVTQRYAALSRHDDAVGIRIASLRRYQNRLNKRSRGCVCLVD